MDALTRGGPGGLPRPIELHAHDPLRYVGDMLAWVHQAIAAEREFLESLFGVRDARRMVGAVRAFGASEEEGWIAEMMDGAVRGLCGPLKVRVQQTVRSQESSITSYKIANLVQFYMVTMHRTIGKEALLSKTLEEWVLALWAWLDLANGAAQVDRIGVLRILWGHRDPRSFSAARIPGGYWHQSPQTIANDKRRTWTIQGCPHPWLSSIMRKCCAK